MNYSRKYLLREPTEDDFLEKIPAKYEWLLPVLTESFSSHTEDDIDEDSELDD
jgi:hypothetical protein